MSSTMLLRATNFDQHATNITKIESSTEHDGTKLIQAQEGFPKAKENIMSIQGPMEKIEKSEEDLVKQKEELLAKLRPIQDELWAVREKCFELWASRETNEKNKDFLCSSTK